jgi:hypothetical protein
MKKTVCVYYVTERREEEKDSYILQESGDYCGPIATFATTGYATHSTYIRAPLSLD